MYTPKTYCLAIFLLVALLQGAALAFSGEELSPRAKVTLPQAREIALKAYQGKIVSEELEEESGGSGLRYSFDISGGKGTHEVGVDAKTGTVLENSVEGKNPD